MSEFYKMVVSKPELIVDLTNCDREPIHLLGRIQSHGILLGFEKSELILGFASENVWDYIEEPSNGNKLHIRDFFGSDIIKALKGFELSKEFSFFYPDTIQFAGLTCNLYVSENNEYYIFELEQAQKGKSRSSYKHQFLNEFLGTVEFAENLSELASSIAISFRKFTGYDRVMVYQFDELGNGEVIGEDKSAGLESFLGLRYPVSDIPNQARQLYKTNLIREIKNVEDSGIPVRYIRNRSEPVDLSYSIFRSVSPIHIQYLKNMGVMATFAITILDESNDLWGMIICHHYKVPRSLTFPMRFFSLAFSKVATQSIRNLEMKIWAKWQKKSRFLLQKAKVASKKGLQSSELNSLWPEVADLLSLQGILVKSKDITYQFGEIPEKSAIDQLSTDLNLDGSLEIKHTNRHNADVRFAGIMAIPISSKESTLFFFRKSSDLTVNWAGNPNKPMEFQELNGVQYLSPRRSFELYKENIKGYAPPWLEDERNFASTLQDVIMISLIQDSHLDISEEITAMYILNKGNIEIEKRLVQLSEDLLAKEVLLEEYQTAARTALKINAQNTEMLANMSHEMRTPLNGIVGLAQLIKSSEQSKEELLTYSEMILSSSDRLLTTVNRILEMARLEKTSMTFEFKRIYLKEFMSSFIGPLKYMAEIKRQRLTTIVHNEKEPVVSDPEILVQIITNLVSNAIKYTPEGGNIEINLKLFIKSKSRFLCISVEDNGLGISEKDQSRIFEPFVMAASSTRIADKSSGLGLYLVRKYVDYLNGDIELTSTIGVGSHFKVIIPINKMENEDIIR